MKHLLFVASFLLGSVFDLSAQDSQVGLARVTKIQGVEAYFMCEPVRDYEVVLDQTTGFKAASVLTGGLINESVADKASQFVKRSVKEAQEQGKTIDAVVYSSGKQIVAVKWKDAGTVKNKGLARVKKINGIEVYVMNEPVRDYEVVNQKSGGTRMKSFLTGGLVNNSIEEDIDKMTKRVKEAADTEKKQIDAVVYSTGKSAIGIKFK